MLWGHGPEIDHRSKGLQSKMKYPEHGFSPATPIAVQVHVLQKVWSWNPAQPRKRDPVKLASVMEGNS
jgi:hypothetical protein